MASMGIAHGKVFLASFLLLLFTGTMLWRIELRESGPKRTAEITVEHAGSFGLRLSLSSEHDLQFMEVGHDSEDPIKILLPADLERREVRGVPLASITFQPDSTGQLRWTIPPNALVSFRTDEPWNELLIRNPSKIPFKVEVTTVNLETQETEKDVFLMKDQPLVLR